MSSFVYLVTVGVWSSFVCYSTKAQETIEIQPYQKAYSVSGLNWGLVADLDYVCIYGHINLLKLTSNHTGLHCGFSLATKVEPFYRILCTMIIEPQTVCIADPRRDIGNVCYCEDRKRESMTIVMNMTARKDMNDSAIFFWLENENMSIRIPEPIFESKVVSISPINVVQAVAATNRPLVVSVDTPYMRLIGSFQVLVFAFFTVAAIILIVILVALIRRFNSSTTEPLASSSAGQGTVEIFTPIEKRAEEKTVPPQIVEVKRLNSRTSCV